jgi:phosphomannomutase
MVVGSGFDSVPDALPEQNLCRAVGTLCGEIHVIKGARVEFPDIWGLVRASNTSPYLILRFEAETPERMREIEATVTGMLERQVKA